jgi:membrane-associated phospholipid phosphatase
MFLQTALRRNLRRPAHSAAHRHMPILVLLFVALLGGFLIFFAFDRLAPARGATAALADAAEEMLAKAEQRNWWQMRMDATVATGLALSAAVVAMILGGLIVAVLAYLVRGNATLMSIDSSVARWGSDHATQTSTRMLYWVTDLGDWLCVPIGVAILIYEWRRAPNRYLLPFLLVVYLGDKLVTNAVKGLIDRARPTLNPIAETLGPSFPSGHSSTAAAFYAALALILARRRSPRVRALLAGGAGAIAIAVAASRVLLGVHWLSDVIAGVFLGWLWFAICAVAFGGRRLEFAEPVEHVMANSARGPQQRRAASAPAAKLESTEARNRQGLGGVSRARSGPLPKGPERRSAQDGAARAAGAVRPGSGRGAPTSSRTHANRRIQAQV